MARRWQISERRQPLLAVLEILEGRDQPRVMPPGYVREGGQGRAFPLRYGIALLPCHLP